MTTLNPSKQQSLGLCELYCHGCKKYLVFKLKSGNNGNIIIPCSCGHDHKRVCENGVVTSDRWGDSNSFASKIQGRLRRKSAFAGVRSGEFKTYDESLLASYTKTLR